MFKTEVHEHVHQALLNQKSKQWFTLHFIVCLVGENNTEINKFNDRVSMDKIHQ